MFPERRLQDPLIFVPQDVLIKLWHLPLFCQQHLSINCYQCNTRSKCSPSSVGLIFLISFPKDDLLLTCVKNVVSQFDILMIGLRIEVCSSHISQFLNVVDNSINWCIDIKIHLFDHPHTG